MSDTAKIPAGATPIRIAQPGGAAHLFASHTPAELIFYRRQDGLHYRLHKRDLLPAGAWELLQVLQAGAQEHGAASYDLARSLLNLYKLVLLLRPLAEAQRVSAFELAERLLTQSAQ